MKKTNFPSKGPPFGFFGYLSHSVLADPQDFQILFHNFVQLYYLVPTYLPTYFLSLALLSSGLFDNIVKLVSRLESETFHLFESFNFTMTISH